MWRLIKKWWLLRHLDKEIVRHTLKEPLERITSGGKVLLTQKFFIEGTNDYPGLARNSLKRFSGILRWRKKDNPEKLKKRVREYNDIFESCLREDYINLVRGEGNLLVAEKGPCYDDTHGIAGLIQLLGNKFSVVWYLVGMIFTLIVGLNGGTIWNYVKSLTP